MKQTLGENADKFQGDDHATLQSKVDEVIKQLDTMESASKEEFEALQKELEGVANPIMQRFYSSGGAPGGGGGGMPGGAPGGFPGAGGAGGDDGPSVEEVD